MQDAMRLDKDFNSNAFPSNVIYSSAEVLVITAKLCWLQRRIFSLILRLDESEEDSNSKSDEVTDVETQLKKE